MTETFTFDPAAVGLEHFLEAFGKRSDVRAEIEAYWNHGGASPYPISVFNHLIDKREEAGKIAPERAEFLKAYFAESFAPEPVTGYLHKHRETLIRELLDWYTDVHPERRFYRVEADIMNLGGLNRDIIAADPSKANVADAVIRVMAGILRKHLEPLGETCAIRHGGDELSLYVQAKTGTDKEVIKTALEAAQKEIAEFVCAAGLRDVRHTKRDRLTNKVKDPGVGLGCAVVDARIKDEIGQMDEMARGVTASKHRFQEFLGPMARASAVAEHYAGVDVQQIEEVLKEPVYAQYRWPPLVPLSLLHADKDFSGDTLEQAQQARVSRHMEQLVSAPLSAAEKRLGDGVALLSRKIDYVTDLPLFGAMRDGQMPHFSQRYGSKAMLVHFDFNNMGGGNDLGEWVGNKMGHLFGQCILDSLQQLGFAEYAPYLTSQGGGKFAMLLPQSLGQKAILDLSNAVEKKLETRSHEDLKLTPQQLVKTREIIEEATREQLKNRRGGDHASLRQRPILLDSGVLTVADISNVKTRRSGSHVVCKAVAVDVGNPEKPLHLGYAMAGLEELARKGQQAITNIEQRHFERKRQSDKPTSGHEAIVVDEATAAIAEQAVRPKFGDKVQIQRAAKSDKGTGPSARA